MSYRAFFLVADAVGVVAHGKEINDQEARGRLFSVSQLFQQIIIVFSVKLALLRGMLCHEGRHRVDSVLRRLRRDERI